MEEELHRLTELGRELVVGHFSRLLAAEIDRPDFDLNAWLSRLAAPAAVESNLTIDHLTVRTNAAGQLGRLAVSALEAAEIEAGVIRPQPVRLPEARLPGRKPKAEAERQLAYLQLPEGRAKTIMAMHLGVDGHEPSGIEQIGQTFDLPTHRVADFIRVISGEIPEFSERGRYYQLSELYPYLPEGRTREVVAVYLDKGRREEYPSLETIFALQIGSEELSLILDQALRAEPWGRPHARQQRLRQIYPTLPEGREKQMVALYVGEDGHKEQTQEAIDEQLALDAGQTDRTLGQILDQQLAEADHRLRRQKLRRLYPALPEDFGKQVVAMYIGEDGHEEQTQAEIVRWMSSNADAETVQSILSLSIYDHSGGADSLEARIQQLKELYPAGTPAPTDTPASIDTPVPVVSSEPRQTRPRRTRAPRLEGDLWHDNRQMLATSYQHLVDGQTKTMVAMCFGFDGHEVTPTEQIAAALSLDPEIVNGVIGGFTWRRSVSNVWRRHDLRQLYPHLPDGEAKTVVAMHLGIDGHQERTQAAIAREFNTSGSMIDTVITSVLRAEPRGIKSNRRRAAQSLTDSDREQKLRRLYPYLTDGDAKTVVAMHLGIDGHDKHDDWTIASRLDLPFEVVAKVTDRLVGWSAASLEARIERLNQLDRSILTSRPDPDSR